MKNKGVHLSEAILSIVLGLSLGVILLGCRFFQRIGAEQPTSTRTVITEVNETPTSEEATGESTSAPAQISTPPSREAAPSPETQATVNLFLIALADQGKSGRMIGCGDSLIPIAQQVEGLKEGEAAPAEAKLRAAIQALLSIKEQYYGQSGLYNALYQSDLQVDEIKIEQGTAEIQLSGMLQLGGVCDNPRVDEQLKATAHQFPEVLEVKIWINGIPLEELLSEK